MNWKKEFIKLLEADKFSTDSEIDDYADEHNLPAAEVWQCVANYNISCLIKGSIGTPCEGCKHVAEGSIICRDCCRNKTDFYEERK